MDNMAKCKKCSSALPDGAKFCPQCGKRVETGKKRSNTSRPNGTGSVYKRGNTWECAVTLGYIVKEDGKRKAVRPTKGGFKTKKEAMEYIPILRNEPVRKMPTLQQLYDRYLQSPKYQKLSDSRKEKYPIAWNKIKHLWFMRIDLLTTFDMQDAIDSASDTFYTARDIKNLFSKLYQIAMPDKFVTVNLSQFIDLPVLNAKEPVPFSDTEIKSLWADYLDGNWWTGYILLMIYTGMMPGELLGCRKASIDLEKKQIFGEGLKTEKRRDSSIVLADILIPVVSDLLERTDGDKLIKINKDRFYTVYYETIERAGCRKLTPYACRHTAATSLALENIPPSVIQKVMRHAKFSSTEKYIHVDVSPMLDAVNQLKSGSGATSS